MGMFYQVDSPRLIDYEYKFPVEAAMAASNKLNEEIGKELADVGNLDINAKTYTGDVMLYQQLRQNLNDEKAEISKVIRENPLDKSYMPRLQALRSKVNNINSLKEGLEKNYEQEKIWRSKFKPTAILRPRRSI